MSKNPTPPLSVQRYFSMLEYAGKKNGVNPLLLGAIMEQESEGQPDATGPLVPGQGRAQGPMQFMPRTAQEFALTHPDRVMASVNAAAKMLSGFFKQGMSVEQAVAHYGGSPGNPSDDNYVRGVAQKYNGFADWVKSEHNVTLPPSFHSNAVPYKGPMAAPVRTYTGPPVTLPNFGDMQAPAAPLVPPENPVIENGPQEEGTVLGNAGMGLLAGALESVQEPLRLYERASDAVPGISPLGPLAPIMNQEVQHLTSSVEHYYHQNLRNKLYTGEIPYVLGNALGTGAVIASGEGALGEGLEAVKGLPVVGKIAETAKNLLTGEEDLAKTKGALQKGAKIFARGASQGAMAGAASAAKGQNVAEAAGEGAAFGAPLNVAGHLVLGTAGETGKALKNLLVKMQGASEDAATQRAAEQVANLFPHGVESGVAEAKAKAGPAATLYDTQEGRRALTGLAKRPYMNSVLQYFANTRNEALSKESLEKGFLANAKITGPIKDTIDKAKEANSNYVNEILNHLVKTAPTINFSPEASDALHNGWSYDIINKAIKEGKKPYGPLSFKTENWPHFVNEYDGVTKLPYPIAQIAYDNVRKELFDELQSGGRNRVKIESLKATQRALRGDGEDGEVSESGLNSNPLYQKMMLLNRSNADMQNASDAGASFVSSKTSLGDVQKMAEKLTPEQKLIIPHAMIDNIYENLFKSPKGAASLAKNLNADRLLKAKLSVFLEPKDMDTLFEHVGHIAEQLDTAKAAIPKNSTIDGVDNHTANILGRTALEHVKGWASGIGVGGRALLRWAGLHDDVIGDHAFHRIMSMPAENAAQQVTSLISRPSIVKAAVKEAGLHGSVALGAALQNQNKPIPNPKVVPAPALPNLVSLIPTAHAMGSLGGVSLPGQGLGPAPLPVAGAKATGNAVKDPSPTPAALAATHVLVPIGGLPLVGGGGGKTGNGSKAKALKKLQRQANSPLPVQMNFTTTAPAPY